MFCKYCGSELSDDALFCKSCGKKLTSADGQDSAPVSPETTGTPLADVEPLFHDHDTEDMPVTPAKPSWFEKVESAMKRSPLVKRIKELPRAVVVAAAVLCLIAIGLPIKKRIAVEAYKKSAAWTRYESLYDMHSAQVNTYNANKTPQNAAAEDKAGLDALEAYLDYYEGKKKIQGKGDYSGLDEEVEEWILTLENNHSIRSPWGASDFDYRLAILKNRWKYLKR